MIIDEIDNPDQRKQISDRILRALPEWFGIEDSILTYVKDCRSFPMYAIFNKNEAIGFVSIKKHFQSSSELYVLGLLKEYHRQGLGKRLIKFAEEKAKSQGVTYITVKTLSENRQDEYYDKTRLFYLGMNYQPLEEFKTLWDPSNPCLMMVKYLGD